MRFSSSAGKSFDQKTFGIMPKTVPPSIHQGPSSMKCTRQRPISIIFTPSPFLTRRAAAG
jgi:hypothetical protein